MRIRDLDYLATPPEISDLVLLYHYRSEVMRRAMRNAIAARFREARRKLVACSPFEFTRLLNPGSLFDPTNLVPFIDFGYSPTPGQADETWVLSPVELVRGLASGAPSAAVVFLPSGVVNDLTKVALWPFSSTSKLVTVEAPVRVARRDISRIVQLVAHVRNTPATSEVIESVTRSLRDTWLDTPELAALADAADRQLTMGQSAGLGITSSRSIEVARNVLVSALGKVVRREGSRDDVLRHFEGCRDGADIVTQLLSATARLILMATHSPKPSQRQRATNQLAAWTLLLISRLKDLASATGTRSLWPSADLRIHDLQMLLDMHLEVSRGPSKVATFFELEALAEGAKVARQLSTELSERLAERLDFLMPALGDRDEPFRAALMHLKLALNGEVAIRPSQDGGTASTLTSFDQWVGGEMVPFVFLQRFASRRFDRPLLLVGPDSTGKRVAADLMARLYVCKVATPDHPTACGKCFGCGTAEFSIQPIDVLAHLGAGADKFVEDAINNRGTIGGEAAHAIYGVEHVSHEAQDKLLKKIESGQLSGLTIFTTRAPSSLLDAFRSRCLTILLWPLQHSERALVEARMPVP